MAIALVPGGAYTGSGTTSVTSIAATAPAGIVAGNTLVAVAYNQVSGGTITAPAGWTLAPGGSNNTFYTVGVFTKTAGASEPSTYTFSCSGSNVMAALITQYSGVAGVDGSCAISGTNSGVNSFPAPSVTPSQNNDYWVTASWSGFTNTYSVPAGAALAAGGTGGWLAISEWYTALSSSAATGTQTIAQTTAVQMGTMSLLLKAPTAGVSATGTGAIAFDGAGTATVVAVSSATGTGAITFAGSGVASQHGTVTASGTGAITFAGAGRVAAASSDIPTFAPPEWAWYLLKPTGEFITALTTATARQLAFPIDAAATAQFTMPGVIDLSGPAPETALVKELATDVYVTRNGRPVFRGRVGTSAETHANDADTVQFTAVDYRGLLDHRIIWPGSQLTFNATFPPNDESAIAWQMITDSQAQAGGDLGITEGTGIGTTGVLRDRTYTAGVPLGQTLDELANLENGFEWEVDSNLAFNVFYPQRGRDQTASQVLAYGRGLTAITSTVNTDAYANAVYYTGHQPETMPVEELLGIFPPGVGRWESQVTDPNVTLQATVEEQGQAALLTASQLDPAFTLTMSPAWWEPGDIWLGDLVQVQVRDGRLDVDVARRVVNIAITLDDDGTETVVLTANVPTPASATRSALAPPPNPGGAGKVSKFSQRIHSLDHRVSKLELVAAQGGGDLPYYAAEKGPSTALTDIPTLILTTPDIPTGRYLVTVNATYTFSAADTAHISLASDTGDWYGSDLTITHIAVGNFGEVYMSSVTYVMIVVSEGTFALQGIQLNPTSDCTVLGNFISAGGQCVTGYALVKIGNYP